MHACVQCVTIVLVLQMYALRVETCLLSTEMRSRRQVRRTRIRPRRSHAVSSHRPMRRVAIQPRQSSVRRRVAAICVRTPDELQYVALSQLVHASIQQANIQHNRDPIVKSSSLRSNLEPRSNGRRAHASHPIFHPPANSEPVLQEAFLSAPTMRAWR